jgi:outer membrane translocation and assembly module TamA
MPAITRRSAASAWWRSRAHRHHRRRGPDDTDVPFFKFYFLGGSNSLRGWGRFEVSPLSGSGLPIGGHSMVEMSSELRTPLFGKSSIVLFADAGSVAGPAWQVDPLRYDVGTGLRYLTPVGPSAWTSRCS